MPNKTTITCPNCKTQIDVNEIQYHELEERLKREHEKELDAKRKEYKVHLEKLNAREERMKEQEEKFEEQLLKATKEQVRLEKQKLQTQLKKELEAEQSEALATLQKELATKSEQVKELNNSKIEIEKLKREKSEIASAAKVEAQKALSEELKLEKEKLAKLAEEARVQAQMEMTQANELKMKAKDEQLEQIKRELDNARRKAEQGSMQIQGEALELAIESWLSSQFPFDNIEEVKKGAFGADCVQTVHTREVQNCGVICYESKNTKSWSDGWITKLKQDMLKVNADIGVLVTSVYPKEMNRMGFVDGIWVCSLDEFKGSVSLLRESLIRLQQVALKEENKSDKMSLLYNYMTGNEFSMQMKAIVDGFMAMQTELDKEKRSLMATWKRNRRPLMECWQILLRCMGRYKGLLVRLLLFILMLWSWKYLMSWMKNRVVSTFSL